MQEILPQAYTFDILPLPQLVAQGDDNDEKMIDRAKKCGGQAHE